MMPFSPADKATQERLSLPSRRFLDFVERHPQLLSRATFGDFFRSRSAIVPTLSGVPASEPYPLQPWPFFLSPQTTSAFAQASVGLARLVRSLPRRFFRNDPRAIARFYGLENETTAALLLAEPSFLDATICRGDFILTAAGLQCIELNVGVLGGWQHVALAPLYLEQPEIAVFLAEEGITAAPRNAIHLLLRHVVRHSLSTRLGAGDALHLLVVASDGGTTSVDTHPLAVYEAELARVLQEAGGRCGSIAVARFGELSYPGLSVAARGQVYQAVIEQSESLPSRELIRSFKAGKVNLYTGPIGLLTSDKRNLALLSEHGSSDVFTATERAWIARHVPWTRVLGPGSASFRGVAQPLPELVRRHRADLVLKAAGSFGGSDVYVGAFLSDDAWEERVEAALAAGGWVVQERLEPLPHIGQHGESGWAPFDIVWGLYVFGNDYGGVFVRMAPQGEIPVLNISQGARLGLAFEVSPSRSPDNSGSRA